MTEHHQWLLTNPKESLANACRIANAAVRADYEPNVESAVDFDTATARHCNSSHCNRSA